MYHNEVDTFIKWCDTHYLILNVTKEQEMVLDPRQVTDHESVVIKNQKIIQVSSYKYLVVHIDNLLGQKTHIDHLCNRLQHRLYLLR